MQRSRTASLTAFLWQHLPVLLKGTYRRSVLRLPYAFSFDLADRCPIGCHCYWRAQQRVHELSDDEVVAFFQRKCSEGYVLANIVGGEPYVRPELLTRVAGIIPFNWLITSGATPLRRLRGTTHIISVDGSNADTHDHVRGGKGLYARIIRNLERARADGGFHAFIHITLNALNYKEIGEICSTWKCNGLADGILVSTLTPIRDGGDDHLRLLREQRVWIVEELLRLKGEYGGFLLQTEEMIRRLHPNHTARLHPGICDTAKLIESYDAAGNRISKCILSEKADCRECGCVVTTMSDSTRPSQLGGMLETMKISMRLFSW